MEQIIKKNITAALFGALMFLQFTLLGLGNRAGEGWLSSARRELVYYGLQAAVILGFWAYAAGERFIRRERVRKFAGGIILAVLFAGS